MRNWGLWRGVIVKAVAGANIGANIIICSLPLDTIAQSLPSTSPQSPRVFASPTSERFFIKKVQVLGSTVLQSQIARLIQKFENREITFEK